MMEEYNIFDEECYLNLNLLDEEQIQTLQQCLNTECIELETNFESFNFNNISENFSQIFSESSSSLPSSQILSFDNLNSTKFYGIDQKQNQVATSVSLPELGNTHFSTQISKGSMKNQKLETKTSLSKSSRANAQDHILAERKRRENLSQNFIALAALVPGLKKTDKASVLADAIKYVKELKERLEVLEEQGKKAKEKSVVAPLKPDLCSDEHYSSSDDESTKSESVDDANDQLLFKVETKVSGKDILIRIHCKKHMGLLVKLISEIQNLQLFIVNSSVIPFGDSIQDITVVAEIGEGYNLTIKELVKKLRMAALKFIS